MAERTSADKKGGHLAKRLSDGRLMLRESAMCPDEDKASFEDISKHKFFNTNNLWVNLPKLKASTLQWPFWCLRHADFLHHSCPTVTHPASLIAGCRAQGTLKWRHRHVLWELNKDEEQ